MILLQKLKKALISEENGRLRSHAADRIASEALKDQFIADPDFPFLVSSGRTGSHWLRILMELYFGKPSLRLLFFHTVNETKDYTCYHTHDLDLTVQRKRVIYLYREPVDTIFSQMWYQGEGKDDEKVLAGLADLYVHHLHKWLIEENFTSQKVILTYEGMNSNLAGEFEKICGFFNYPFDGSRLEATAAAVSKEKIKDRTPHDPRVINTASDYARQRDNFRAKHSERIWEITFKQYPDLIQFFRK